jgi:hypothetical protein
MQKDYSVYDIPVCMKPHIKNKKNHQNAYYTLDDVKEILFFNNLNRRILQDYPRYQKRIVKLRPDKRPVKGRETQEILNAVLKTDTDPTIQDVYKTQTIFDNKNTVREKLSQLETEGWLNIQIDRNIRPRGRPTFDSPISRGGRRSLRIQLGGEKWIEALSLCMPLPRRKKIFDALVLCGNELDTLLLFHELYIRRFLYAKRDTDKTMPCWIILLLTGMVFTYITKQRYHKDDGNLMKTLNDAHQMFLKSGGFISSLQLYPRHLWGSICEGDILKLNEHEKEELIITSSYIFFRDMIIYRRSIPKINSRNRNIHPNKFTSETQEAQCREYGVPVQFYPYIIPTVKIKATPISNDKPVIKV